MMQQAQRHLAAILFTDIVGYTSMMQQNETLAVEVLMRYSARLRKTVEFHKGEVLNDYGDGSLCSFPSALVALTAAIELQKDLRTGTAIPLRIGLHIGEIFYEDEKVFGDGINVASRIQSLGAGNSILLSSVFNNTIKNHTEFKTVSIGKFHFMHVEEPMEVFALANEGFTVPKRNELTGKLRNEKDTFSWKKIAIASVSLIFFVGAFLAYRQFFSNAGASLGLRSSLIVLPFSTQDSGQSYFAEGIATDVITELSNVRKIKTLSWNTSEHYTNSKQSLKEIAGETKVRYVLTIKIQKERQNIRINVALVNPENDQSLWAQRWDQDFQSVFAIQKQIAKEVAAKLGVKLSFEENVKLDRSSTNNFEAYDIFLKARAESRKAYDSIHLHKSNQLLEEALKIEPDFPQALTLRANNNIDLAFLKRLDPVLEGAKVREDLMKSLELDSTYSDTYMVLGTANWYLDWNMKEAEKNLKKGWELSNFGEAPITQCFCGIVEFTMIKGDYQGALSLISKVEKIDPNYPYAKNEIIWIYGIQKDTVSLRKIISEPLKPASLKAMAFYFLGNYDEAIKGYLEEDISMPDPYLAAAYYKHGEIMKSDSIINQLIGRSGRERNIDFVLAVIFAARGENGKALQWYNSAFLKHDLMLVYTRAYPDLAQIAGEPVVKQILKEIGL